MKVLALCGSLRAASMNAALLRATARLAPDDLTVEVFSGLGDLPLFNPDLEASMPAPVRHLQAAIAACDALVIASPEYAHGMPGSLKNALDWLVSGVEIAGKATLVWSASPSGALHAHPQLLEVLRTMSADVLLEGALQVTSARRAFAADGRLVDEDLGRTLGESLGRLRERLAAPP